MTVIKCNCEEPSCNSELEITDDGYLIIRERHEGEHHIASIKPPSIKDVLFPVRYYDYNDGEWHTQQFVKKRITK